MKYATDIQKLVIKNVLLVESSQNILDSADEWLVAKIWQTVAANAGGDFKTGKDEDGNYFLTNENWPKPEEDALTAAFWLDGEGEEIGERSWLSVLCGLVPGTSGGFFFWYDWTANGIKRKAWKEFLKDFFANNPGLRENGFSLNEAGTAIVMPLRLDLERLAADFPDADSAFEPAAEAADAIFSQRETFKDLFQKAAKLIK